MAFRTNPAPPTIYRHELQKIERRWERNGNPYALEAEVNDKAWEAFGEERLRMRWRRVKTPDADFPWDVELCEEGFRFQQHPDGGCELWGGAHHCNCPYVNATGEHVLKATHVFEEYIRPMWLKAAKAEPWNACYGGVEYFYTHATGYEIKVDIGQEVLIEREKKVRQAKRMVTRRRNDIERRKADAAWAIEQIAVAEEKLVEAEAALADLNV